MSFNMKKFVGVLLVLLCGLIGANALADGHYLNPFWFGLMAGWSIKGIVALTVPNSLN